MPLLKADAHIVQFRALRPPRCPSSDDSLPQPRTSSDFPRLLLVPLGMREHDICRSNYQHKRLIWAFRVCVNLQSQTSKLQNPPTGAIRISRRPEEVPESAPYPLSVKRSQLPAQFFFFSAPKLSVFRIFPPS